MLNDFEHELVEALKSAEDANEESHPFADLECLANDPDTAYDPRNMESSVTWLQEFQRRSHARELIAQAEQQGTSRFSR